MSKSFYELDSIIDISEKRLAEYTALYQKALERFTNIILVYSAEAVFLIPLTQHTLAADIHGFLFYIIFILFITLLCISVIYLIRLLLPADIAYLYPPRMYYATFKKEMESSPVEDQQQIDDSLKASYIIELEDAIDNNNKVMRRKSSFFYNSLVFALVAIIPYIVCIGFHLKKH